MLSFYKTLPLSSTFHKPDDLSSNTFEDNYENYAFFNKNIRGFQFYFTLYFPNNNQFISCVVNFKVNPLGNISPGKMIFHTYKPDIYYANSLIIEDIIRLLICLIFFFTSLITFIVHYIKHRDFVYTFNYHFLSFIINFVLLIVFGINLDFKLTYLYNNPSDSIQIQPISYIDSLSTSNYYNLTFFYEAIILFIITVKFLSFLRLSDDIRLFFVTLKTGLGTFIKYLFIFIPMMILVTFSVNVVLGSKLSNYKDFNNSFASIVFALFGQLNTLEIVKVNEGFCILYSVVIIIITLFFMNSVFVSIFTDVYRRNIIANGYAGEHEQNDWIVTDYIRWVFFCLGRGGKKEQVVVKQE